MRKCKFLGVFIPKSLHHMKRYNTQKQISIAEFAMPFEAKLDENNRWIVLSQVILAADADLQSASFRQGICTSGIKLVVSHLQY